ncbi:Dolichyl-phosphate-mannose-protein mannosyltransferase [Haloplanus vescus]|uniref:Dolichyl-phosphate-mannose-protein mannosyltransferase n=1 Tax=Haloplanus vescus TaxID=555874 RepID=A0A1H3XI52_9EURY|nr:phospholipid carrier-dependent glycosyltransferase [Haloplanus vescus]SDZ98292.1 Dolichyl-phosphate-mannose-protein mannosyltransferase [Haloplanus vescus]
MDKEAKQTIPIFVLTLILRFISAGITTVTNLNPDSQADAIKFGNTAALIARGISNGQPYRYVSGSVGFSELIYPLTSVDPYNLWGSFLSPFWLLPGPSGLYARLGNAFLGAFAIYNVYLIARYYHSHHAGITAALPMIFYPSFVAIHSTLLREAIILFAITTAARLLILPLQQRPYWFSYALAAVLLHISLLQRDDNAIIIAAAIGAAIAAYMIKSGYISKSTTGLGLALSPVAFVLSLPVIRDGVEFLAYIRVVRARGRTIYLPDVIPQTILELAAFSWVGGAYFLYAPFPWMIETIPDLLVGIEGLVSIAFTMASIWGIRSLGQKNPSATIGLLVGLVVAVILYGVGTVNYGTGMRHRQMFLWVIFLFGGIGISEHVKFVWPFRWGKDSFMESDPNRSSSD